MPEVSIAPLLGAGDVVALERGPAWGVPVAEFVFNEIKFWG